MFAKLKLIYDGVVMALSFFKLAKEAYKKWKISRIEKAIQKRKKHLKEQSANIQHEASQEPSEESDEKLKEYYRKLYRANNSK